MALCGLLNIGKPPGCTSRDAVDRVKRLVRPAKVGHAGTLDPLASGVLVICVGKATRLIQYVQQMRKSYRATFLLGHQSDTDDVEGTVVAAENARVPSREQLELAVPRFIGQIQQRPPAYSAIKLQGRRAYQLARQGRPPELAARTVNVFNLRVEQYCYPEVNLSIECGSGMYVRALGRDLAAALGTTAVMSALRRLAIGRFHVEHALALNDVSADSLRQCVQPPLSAVANLPRVVISEGEVIELLHGRPINRQSSKPSAVEAVSRSPVNEWAAIDSAGRLVAVLWQKHPGQLWPEINFETSDESVEPQR